jgi:hypothetical protein
MVIVLLLFDLDQDVAYIDKNELLIVGFPVGSGGEPIQIIGVELYDSLAKRFGRDMVALIHDDVPECIGQFLHVLYLGQGLDQGNRYRFARAEFMITDLPDPAFRDLQEILDTLHPLIEQRGLMPWKYEAG